MLRRNTLIMPKPDLSRFLPLLNSGVRGEELKEFRGHGRTGRPLGDERFLERLEGLVGRALKPQKGGRPRKQ